MISNLMLTFKGGYLDFSHPNKLENTYIIEIYMKRQYKSSSQLKIIKLKKENFFEGVPLKSYIASLVIFRFCNRNQKKHCRENQMTNDA